MTDLLSLWTPGAGFYFRHGDEVLTGVGTAHTITIPASEEQPAVAARRARDLLATVARAPGGPAPVVTGALPFDGSSVATLVVPQTTFVQRAGVTTRIDAGLPLDPAPAPYAIRPFEPVRVSPVPDPAQYMDAVDKARGLIQEGSLTKVVLARMLVAQAPHEIDRRALVAHLARHEPGAYVFGVQGFIGASPELLVERRGRRVRSRPLAGTIARAAGTDAAARLLSSEKDLHEHALVADAVRATLGPLCSDLAAEGPTIVSTSKVHHLATEFRGTLLEPAPDALTLAAILHPTPAVCGTPPAAARAAIAELEQIDRSLYAGFTGWMDADGDGCFAVTLRCAEVAGRIALVFAGAGVVGASDPIAELAETDVKLAAMLDALSSAE